MWDDPGPTSRWSTRTGELPHVGGRRRARVRGDRPADAASGGERVDAAAVALVALAVGAWSLVSERLERADLSAPIVFASLGWLLAEVLHLIEPGISHEAVKLLAEVTLVWVLFADAARVGLRELRHDLGLYTRLLGLGLPLTIAAGTLLAWWMFPGAGGWLALLVGAALAPTDAALGSAVMTHPHVPARIRRVLNVESGLNDGIATPVVTLALAGVAASASGHHGPDGGGAIADVAIGLAVRVGLVTAAGGAMQAARRHGWASEDLSGPSVLALALAAYAGTLWLDGNGFVAAFVAGIAFGTSSGRGGIKQVFFVEQTAGLVSMLTWLVFGAVAVPTVLEQTDWRVLCYAVLSLTAVRLVPVALVLVGACLSRPTVAFV